MIRGSTPTNTFTTDIDLRDATVFVTYQQDGKTILEKTGNELTVTATGIVLVLTQEETLKFHKGDAEIQIRYVFPNGVADGSDIINTTFERILKDGVITP